MKKSIDFWFKFSAIILVGFISLLIVLTKPMIILKGDKDMKLRYNTEYKEPGFTATFVLKNITDKVVVKSNVDTTKLGKYKVKYTINIGKFKISETRNVKVIDDVEPTIELLGSGNACKDQEYVEEGYKATDAYDGDLTDKVTKVVSNDKITYTVRDLSSNKASIVRKIKYQDVLKPNLTLKGEETMVVYLDEEFNDPGVIVTDNCDANINDNIKVDSNVDTTKEGNYKVTYSVTDSSGNKNSIERKVLIREFVGKGTGKTIYLTFDDGPSASITPSLLQILKEENVKATFFIINHSDSLNYLIKQEDDEGHMVALHSYTHNYSYVYSSIDNYFNDLNSIREKVHSITGKYASIIRFPGGSSNTISRKYQTGIMSYLTNEVINRGFNYFDWNISCEDAGSAKNSNDIYNNVVNNLNYTNNVVLLHDFEGNYKTLNAIRDIIRYGKENGYTFKAIDAQTPTVRHSVNN